MVCLGNMLSAWRNCWHCRKFKAIFNIFIDLSWANIIKEKCLGVSAIFWVLSFPRNDSFLNLFNHLSGTSEFTY